MPQLMIGLNRKNNLRCGREHDFSPCTVPSYILTQTLFSNSMRKSVSKNRQINVSAKVRRKLEVTSPRDVTTSCYLKSRDVKVCEVVVCAKHVLCVLGLCGYEQVREILFFSERISSFVGHRSIRVLQRFALSRGLRKC